MFSFCNLKLPVCVAVSKALFFSSQKSAVSNFKCDIKLCYMWLLLLFLAVCCYATPGIGENVQGELLKLSPC